MPIIMRIVRGAAAVLKEVKQTGRESREQRMGWLKGQTLFRLNPSYFDT
jgi:hypothetical protein